MEKTFRERGVLLADAPTGTGKSAAYLAPAILDAATSSSGGRVVVSTATLALQAQLLSEDLPPMRAAAAELMGYPEEEGITYTVLKGRSNFLCVRRHQDTLMAGTILDEDLISNLDLWAAETETGDREDLTFRVPVGPWVEVASDGEDCSPKLCTFREGCFYYAHRDRAGEADLVVVNHSLLLANAASGGAIFDAEGAHLVIDEAHRLEEVMAETFGARVSYGRLRYVMRQAKKRCESAAASADRAEMAAELFFQDLGSGTSVLHESPPRSYDTLVDALISVRSALASDPREEVNALQGMVGRLRRDLVSFYSKPDEDYAYAVVPGRSRRAGGRSYPELKSWLVETAEVFRESVLPLFESGGVVLTSATLATGSGPERSFGYVRRRLGLDEGGPGERGAGERGAGDRVDEFAGEEVFDYEGRCLVYVEEEIAAPTLGSPDIFARSCARRTEQLARLSGGRALVLLSTNRALAAFRESFGPPYPVRYQGDDSPGRLIRWLKETEGAILVGTRTFWEGVDVPGDACVPPGTRVRTDRGYKPIEEIQVGDRVWTHQRRYRKVTATIRRPYEGEVIGVKPYGAPEQLFTPEHPLLVSRYGRGRSPGKPRKGRPDRKKVSLHWVRAGDLTNEDTLALPIGDYQHAYPDPGLSHPTGHRAASWRSRRVLASSWKETEEFWELVGLFAAEGSTHKITVKRGRRSGRARTYYGVTLHFGSHEATTLAEHACDLVARVLGNERPRPRVYGSGCVVSFKNDYFARWLMKNVGTGAAVKQVPLRLRHSPVSAHKQAFLDGYVSGDGSLDKRDGSISTVSASSQLTLGVRDLTLSLGNTAQVRSRKGTGYAEGGRYYWETRWSPSLKYASNIQGRYLVAPPLRIRRTPYRGYVHNLSVDRDESYTLVGVCAHNCSLVVMDRVPFAPPDDPVAARLREKAGERAFREVFLPKAQVAVRQGAGRLMRRAADRGVVALLDPRVAGKGWGRAILKSLPPARRTGSLAEVARFFAEDLREGRS